MSGGSNSDTRDNDNDNKYKNNPIGDTGTENTSSNDYVDDKEDEYSNSEDSDNSTPRTLDSRPCNINARIRRDFVDITFSSIQPYTSNNWHIPFCLLVICGSKDETAKPFLECI